MKIRFYFAVIQLLSLLAVKSWAHLKIDLESGLESNLFLDFPQTENDADSDPNVDIRYFTLLQSWSPVSVRANYGPLTVRQTIYPSSDNNINNLKRNESFDSFNTHLHPEPLLMNGDLSAHLVTKEVRRSNPVLRVLFYAGHTSDYSQRARIDFIDKTLCAAVIVEYQGEKLYGACSPIKSREGACLAEVTIPATYWPPVDKTGFSQKQQKATIAKVSYTILHSEHCTDASFSSATFEQPFISLTYLSDVTLIPFRGTYEEVTNDNVVTILIPQEPVYPNSKIYIPIKFTYNPEYPIAAFSLRVRVKSGIRILGAQLSQPSRGWQISVELNNKQTTATVTAFLRDFDLQQDSQSAPDELFDIISHEVYSWLFEIDEDIDISDSGRIVWQLLYITESSSSSKRDFDKESAKLTSKLDIQKDDVLDVLAITRSRQLLNSACLTGRQVSQAMRVYMVSNAGRVSDVTLQSSCHAADESILKVSPSCTSVYLDGSEVRGSQNATVLIKYGTFTGQGNFIVWMPKLPLEIKPTDLKLSQVKSWKTPYVKRKQHATPIQSDSPSSIDDNSAHVKSSNVRNELMEDLTGNNEMGCRLRYQQARVEVYTRFFSTDHNSGREASLLTRRVAIRVTHLVMPFLRVTDPRILILRGNIIEGLNAGRSEVQVISPITGRLMGAKEIRVAADKETITHLQVTIVAGLELKVKPDESLPNVWMAKTTLLDKLTSQYQEGLLDINLHFSDDTSIPLSDVSDLDYNLSIDTFDGAVAFAPIAGFYPRIIAIGPGRGQLLHVALELANQCQKKRTQPLAMKYVNINVDFATSSLQNDAYNFRKNNGVVVTRNNQSSNNGPLANLKDTSFEGGTKSGQTQLTENGQEPRIQARHNMFVHRTNMTTLEFGMYSILAVFGIAVAIVVVSCSVFALKFKNKTPPEAVTTTRIGPISSTNRPAVANANDWVWLGRATLERNAVKTQCMQTLIPQKDFNGNHHVDMSNSNVIQFREKGADDNENVNRMSGLSFPGSEISIRITTNPNPSDDMDGDDEDENSGSMITIPVAALADNQQISYQINPVQKRRSDSSTVGPPVPARNKYNPTNKFSTYTKPPPIPPHRSKTNLNELKKSSSPKPPPVPPHQNLKITRKSSKPKSQIPAESLRVDLPNNKADWEKLSKRQEYNQLMEYFDNLKESNA